MPEPEPDYPSLCLCPWVSGVIWLVISTTVLFDTVTQTVGQKSARRACQKAARKKQAKNIDKENCEDADDDDGDDSYLKNRFCSFPQTRSSHERCNAIFVMTKPISRRYAEHGGLDSLV